MAWYYKEGNQEIGPVSKADLQGLIKSKRVKADTLVRSSQMDDWRPLSEMVRRKTERQAGPTPPAPPGSPAPDGPSVPMPSTAVCSQCGRSFPEDQVIKYDNQVICAACKPMFVQKLREGVGHSVRAFHYGGFWIRFVAKFIDFIIMGIMQWAILIPLGMLAFTSMPRDPGQVPPSGLFMMMGAQILIGFMIPMVYNTFFIGRFAATPGKMACRLMVVNPEGERISYMRALGRGLGELVTGFTFTIGYIIAGFDSEKRALHDRICSTRVIYK